MATSRVQNVTMSEATHPVESKHQLEAAIRATIAGQRSGVASNLIGSKRAAPVSLA
jgi:hypothetical protein